MTFKPTLWRPIAAVLSGINLIAVGAAANAAEPWHAGVHALLAVAFGLWAQRLHGGTVAGDLPARLEVLEIDVNGLRRELNETQERLDFAERILAQAQESRRLDLER